MASVIGGPLSGVILSLHHFLDLKGWQWLYIFEAVPAMILGVAGFFILTDRPADAAWLQPDERILLQERLDQDLKARLYTSRWGNSIGLLLDKRVLYYAALFFTTTSASSGLSLWLPQIVKEFGLSYFQTGLISAIPFALGAIAMVTWGLCLGQAR